MNLEGLLVESWFPNSLYIMDPPGCRKRKKKLPRASFDLATFRLKAEHSPIELTGLFRLKDMLLFHYI